MSINRKGYFESVSSYDINEQCQMHVDVVVGSDD
jgi:hypothetical protein